MEREHDFTNRRIGRRAFQRPIRACWSVNRRGRPARASNDPNAGRSCSRTCCSRCTTPPPSIRSRTCNSSIHRSFPSCNNAVTFPFFLSFLVSPRFPFERTDRRDSTRNELPILRFICNLRETCLNEIYYYYHHYLTQSDNETYNVASQF